MCCQVLSRTEVIWDWLLTEPAGLLFPTPVLEQPQGESFSKYNPFFFFPATLVYPCHPHPITCFLPGAARA